MSHRGGHARDLIVQVDRRQRPGVGRQLEEQLRNALRSGALAPGSDLPSTRTLAADLLVSRGVVVRAYAQLAAEGYLEIRQGAPPRVRSLPPTRAHEAPDERRLRYDLRAHKPDVTSFPRHSWLRSLRSALLSAANADLGYLDDQRGLQRVRGEVASYLGRARGVAADPERLVITSGSTHTLSLISRVLARQGAECIGFENPSHRLLHAVARAAGLTPIGVPVDREGLRVDELSARTVPAVVVSPAHQFPTGVTLAPSRRIELVTWARETGGLIVEDDYDAEFRYDRKAIGALQGLAPEQVAYMGSTGKTLSPGIRLGWAMLPERLVTSVSNEILTNVLHISTIDQLAFADFVRRGEFDRHLRHMRAVYRRRRDAVLRELAARQPGVSVSGVAAGLHVVLDLATLELESSVLRRAREHGIAVETLSQHALPGYSGPAGLLVGFGNTLEASIPHAIAGLARCLPAERPA